LPNNNTARIAALAPSILQPGREKGENKFRKILHENSRCDSQEGQPMASTRKSAQSNFSSQKRLMAIIP